MVIGFAVGTAHADVLQVIDDAEVLQDRTRICGIDEGTPETCQEKYNACYYGFSAIENHMIDVCYSTGRCTITREDYSIPSLMVERLYNAPLKAYETSTQVSELNACRANPPAPVPAAPPSDADLERQRLRERILENQRREEMGLPPLPEEVPVAEAAQAAPANQVIDVLPEKRKPRTRTPEAAVFKMPLRLAVTIPYSRCC